MKVGMLWYDDDKSRTLEEKVQRAADYFQEKYGQSPNLCLINPRLSTNGASQKLENIELRTAPNVLIHHFWLGVAESGS